MNQVIIYNLIQSNENDICHIMYPTCNIPINEIARMFVPQGVPYKIIDKSEIPSDMTFRVAWEAVIDKPDGYGDSEGYLAKQEEKTGVNND